MRPTKSPHGNLRGRLRQRGRENKRKSDTALIDGAEGIPKSALIIDVGDMEDGHTLQYAMAIYNVGWGV